VFEALALCSTFPAESYQGSAVVVSSNLHRHPLLS